MQMLFSQNGLDNLFTTPPPVSLYLIIAAADPMKSRFRMKIAREKLKHVLVYAASSFFLTLLSGFVSSQLRDAAIKLL